MKLKSNQNVLLTFLRLRFHHVRIHELFEGKEEAEDHGKQEQGIPQERLLQGILRRRIKNLINCYAVLPLQIVWHAKIKYCKKCTIFSSF
ncbi:hypothetical protein TNCT_738321 [Trichonephila clavata]|uniref:Uncharacterized protein n=1 Tax=Trichonephila clavata TaxID=2740835 RepID=A0A8X6KU57_TRICU|nr:hypothetical protein TNCT_738321 [Trichonephila clavata]